MKRLHNLRSQYSNQHQFAHVIADWKKKLIINKYRFIRAARSKLNFHYQYSLINLPKKQRQNIRRLVKTKKFQETRFLCTLEFVNYQF